MKPYLPRTIRTSGVRGSVTLEAALAMPLFLIAALFLISLVQAATTAMALHSALSQTARLAAQSWHPISLAMERAQAAGGSGPNAAAAENGPEAGTPAGGWGSFLAEYADVLPSPFREWAVQAANGTLNLQGEAMRAAFDALAKRLAEGGRLASSRWAVDRVDWPGEGGEEDSAFIALQAAYRLPFRLPFDGRALSLRETVSERAWIGGKPSASRLADETDTNAAKVAFVSLSPDPARPGRQATLTLRVEPRTAADLTVLYKSGPSKAKHLGTAVADEAGLVRWTWLVGGNTTPGTWEFEVRLPDGGVWRQTFEVSSGSGGDRT
jgi:hypothetical protein